MALVKAKIESIEKWCDTMPLRYLATWNKKPFYVSSVTYEGMPYKVRSMFYPKKEFIGFDPGSAPDENGFYTEMGMYDSTEDQQEV